MADEKKDSPKDSRAALLAQATNLATTAIERQTTLRGTEARRAAVVALHAAKTQLRAAHLLDLDSRWVGKSVAVMALHTGTLLLDLSTIGYIAVKGSRALRVAAAVSLAGHVAAFAVTSLLNNRAASTARAELEARHG